MNTVGIVIPLYNQGVYLREALESIIENEQYCPVQVVVVDDKSTDDSLRIAEKLQVELVTRLLFKILKHETNTGVSVTRNDGIAKLDTKFIICLDADDKLHSNYIKRNVMNLSNSNADVSYCNSQHFGSNNKLYDWPEFSIELLQRENFINCAAMFRKHVWNQVGGFDPNLVHGTEDYEFWIRAARKGFKFQKCHGTHLWYRQSITGGRNENNRKFHHNETQNYIRTKHAGWFLG